MHRLSRSVVHSCWEYKRALGLWLSAHPEKSIYCVYTCTYMYMCACVYAHTQYIYIYVYIIYLPSTKYTGIVLTGVSQSRGTHICPYLYGNVYSTSFIKQVICICSFTDLRFLTSNDSASDDLTSWVYKGICTQKQYLRFCTWTLQWPSSLQSFASSTSPWQQAKAPNFCVIIQEQQFSTAPCASSICWIQKVKKCHELFNT